MVLYHLFCFPLWLFLCLFVSVIFISLCAFLCLFTCFLSFFLQFFLNFSQFLSSYTSYLCRLFSLCLSAVFRFFLFSLFSMFSLHFRFLSLFTVIFSVLFLHAFLYNFYFSFCFVPFIFISLIHSSIHYFLSDLFISISLCYVCIHYFCLSVSFFCSCSIFITFSYFMYFFRLEPRLRLPLVCPAIYLHGWCCWQSRPFQLTTSYQSVQVLRDTLGVEQPRWYRLLPASAKNESEWEVVSRVCTSSRVFVSPFN